MSPKITASSPSTTATEKSIIRERPVDQWRGGFNCKMLPALGGRRRRRERSDTLIRGEIRERR